MTNLKRRPKLVTLTILTTITSLVWVGYSVYQVWKKKPDISIKPEVMEEFSPNLDTQNLSKVKTRTFIEEGEFLIPTPVQEIEQTILENTNQEEILITPTEATSSSPTNTQ